MTFQLKRLLAFMPGSLLVEFSRIEIEREDKDRLTLDSDGRQIVFDKRLQLISHAGKPVASFSGLDSIEVTFFDNGRNQWWTLCLMLRGRRKLAMGRSSDGTEVSIAGAHIATITGKPVHAFRGFLF